MSENVPTPSAELIDVLESVSMESANRVRASLDEVYELSDVDLADLQVEGDLEFAGTEVLTQREKEILLKDARPQEEEIQFAPGALTLEQEEIDALLMGGTIVGPDEKKTRDSLKQQEIDDLLTAISADTGDEYYNQNRRKIKIYNFKRPDVFTRENVIVLSCIHEQLAIKLQSCLNDVALSRNLKQNIEVRAVSVDQLTFGEITSNIPSPALIFELESTFGQMLVYYDPSIQQAIAEGGKPEYDVQPTHREIVGMLSHGPGILPVTLIVDHLSEAWEEFVPNVESKIGRKQTNPMYIRGNPDAMAVVVNFEIKIYNYETTVDIVYMASSLARYKDSLRLHKEPSVIHPLEAHMSTESAAGALGVYSNIPIEIDVRLGKGTYPLQDLLKMGEGTIISLDKPSGDPVDIYANGKLVAHGEVIIMDEKYGVRITEKL